MNPSTQPSVRTAESLGRVTYATKPNTSNVVVGFILGAGLVAGGLLLTGHMLRQLFFGGRNPPQNASDRPACA